jgi:formate--tetrahydrofolate ligase
MLTDIEIAQKAKLRPIQEIAKKAGFLASEVELYGKDKAKINLSAYKRLSKKKNGKLILVTTITPTQWGEGKTTTTIGLGQALAHIGKKAFICIREPSLGPVFGVKGGAAGGGYSQVLPMEDINLHFTGDIHMVTAAHNLLAALIDNHIFHGNLLNYDTDRIVWRRAIDMNDRALRNITLKYRGIERIDGFDITAASEVMAILCLSKDLMDMKSRLGVIITGYSKDGMPITARDIKANGAMTLLLKEALKPNLVQTIEGVPAFVHGGPFANIAHGCNSIVATKLALKASDYVVTEAGFGADLGAEKFFNIKCRQAGLTPDLVIITLTCRALKRQGGVAKEDLSRLCQVYGGQVKNSVIALKKGLPNLERHINSLSQFGVPIVVTINIRPEDSKAEITEVLNFCKELGVSAVDCNIWEKGGNGGIELAKLAVSALKNSAHFKFLYQNSDPIRLKIKKIAKDIYGADGVDFSDMAISQIAYIEKSPYAKLPICMAKTQFSLTDNPELLGAPKGFNINVKRLKISAGAGFIIAYTGDVMTMPGLPLHPAAENIDISSNGEITGLF